MNDKDKRQVRPQRHVALADQIISQLCAGLAVSSRTKTVLTDCPAKRAVLVLQLERTQAPCVKSLAGAGRCRQTLQCSLHEICYSNLNEVNLLQQLSCEGLLLAFIALT